MRVGTGHDRDWSVRVVPNRYPALVSDVTARTVALNPVFRQMGAHGAHEVVIESPDHYRATAEQPVTQLERVLRVLHARCIALAEDSVVRAIVIFRNQGEAAGTSIAHPHWQIIATPVVPHFLRIKQDVARAHFEQSGRNLYTTVLDQELAAGERIVHMNRAFIAFLPFASRLPWQVMILPLTTRASFARIDDFEFRPLAGMLKHVLQRLRSALDDPAYNIVVNCAPLHDEQEDVGFLWHIDVLPRLVTPAGFELGSGMFINSVFPEEAAAVLRTGGSRV